MISKILSIEKKMEEKLCFKFIYWYKINHNIHQCVNALSSLLHSSLRNLRENIHARGLSQSTQMKPQCLPQISLIIADKPQNNINQTVFLCEIMQLAAFLCVICAICGRITCKSTQSILHKWNPRSLPLISQIYADETQNNKTAITATASNNLSFSAG